MSIDTRLYNGSLTREQFLFHEMKITAGLLCEGCSDEETLERIIEDNLFQFPTERMIKNLACVCIRRLRMLPDKSLIASIAYDPVDTAKQVCLYAMMRDNRLVWEFMITVIGEKYRVQDLHFGQIDMNVFFMRLQEQDDKVASWSDGTIKKIKSVLRRVLIENEYIDGSKSGELKPVLITRKLENAIRECGDQMALPAFNCFY